MTADQKTVVFHVGAHKTGTSLVQDYLGQQVKALRTQRILHIPRSPMGRYVGWGDPLIDDPEPFVERLDEFRESDDYDLLVLSHEDTLGHPFERTGGGLYPQARRNLAVLQEILAPFRVRPILSIRRQHEFVASYYLQSVHEGGHKSFDEWVSAIDLEQLSWLPIVDALNESFGEHTVRLIDFGSIRKGQLAYLRQFCELVDPRVEFDADYTVTRSNRSVSGKGLQLALGANRYLTSVTERRDMRDFLQRYFSNADYPQAEPLSDAQEEWLKHRYDPEYERLFGADSPAVTG